MGPSDHTPAQLLIPVPYLGTVNLWLLRGDPLTLVDTGPKSDEAVWALVLDAERNNVRGAAVCRCQVRSSAWSAWAEKPLIV